jgi:hypothetical protein
MSCPVSLSKARRLRSAATKRRLYQERSKSIDGTSDCNMVQQIQSMIQHVQQLTLVVQNLISFGPMYPYAAAMYEGCMLSPDAAISIPFSTDAEQYFPEDVVNPAFQPEVDSTLPATGAQSTTADAGEGDQIVYKIWVPSGKHFIKDGSQTRLDLENEAASRIQSFFRFCSPCSSDGESLGVSELADQLFADGEAGSRDDGSDDAAIVQAFVASTCSNSSSLPSRISFSGTWTPEQINSWVDNALDLALQAETREEGARAFWREWAKADKHLPQDIRTKLVQFFDSKLHSRDFPCLRELVSDEACVAKGDDIKASDSVHK